MKIKYTEMTLRQLEREIDSVQRTLARATARGMERGAKACRAYLKILRLRQVQLRFLPND